MRFIYEQCPPGWHVDHVYPLSGSDVCGLHVPWNLQHLPARDNQAKGNRIGHSSTAFAAPSAASIVALGMPAIPSSS